MAETNLRVGDTVSIQVVVSEINKDGTFSADIKGPYKIRFHLDEIKQIFPRPPRPGEVWSCVRDVQIERKVVAVQEGHVFYFWINKGSEYCPSSMSLPAFLGDSVFLRDDLSFDNLKN